jgi:hypothetical protein
MCLPMSGVRHRLSLCTSEGRSEKPGDGILELISHLGSIIDSMVFRVTPSRDHARPYTALCLVAEEDCRRIRRRPVQHAHLWLLREYSFGLSPFPWLSALTIHARQWGSFWMRYEYMICPVKDLSTNAWHPSTCKPNDVFVWRHYELMQPAAAVASFLVRRSVTPGLVHHGYSRH